MGFATSLKCCAPTATMEDVSHALQGKYRAVNVAKYGRERLERTVTHLVNVTTTVTARRRRRKKENNNSRPQWWPKEVLFARSLQDLKKVVPDAVWNQMLRRLVLLCREFYCEKLRSGKTSSPKKVLCDSQQQNLTPVVYLEDVLKRSADKERFVRGLDLVRVGSHAATGGRPGEGETEARAVAKPLKLSGLPQVPFSSDYGQLLIKKDGGALAETHLKRLERLERYLGTDAAVSVGIVEPAVASERRDNGDAHYCHLYRFPVRQAHQMQSRAAFLRGLCRPVSVRLERCVVPRVEQKKRRVLRVVLTRLKLETARLRRRPHRNNVKQ